MRVRSTSYRDGTPGGAQPGVDPFSTRQRPANGDAAGFDDPATVPAALDRDGASDADWAGQGESRHDAFAHIDPRIVAARDLDDPYVVNVRAIRTRALALQPANGRKPLSLALVGIDAGDHLPVLAANLAVVMVRMGSHVLITDRNGGAIPVNQLFGVAFTPTREDIAGRDAVIIESGVPGLMIAPALTDPDGDDAVEQRPVIEQSRFGRTANAINITLLSVSRSASAETVAAAVTGIDAAVIVGGLHKARIDHTRGLIDSLDEHRIRIAGLVVV